MSGAEPPDHPAAPVLTRYEDRPAGRVAHLLLHRPAARNAITLDLARALRDGLAAAARSADVVVLRGAGGHFCVGGDVHEVSRLRAGGPDALRPLFETFVAACKSIARLGVPVVAAVEGYALAGGFELVQSVDVAVVRDDAVLADHHANAGMIPGGGGSQRLPRLLGVPPAPPPTPPGPRLSGAEAARWGLVYRAVGADEFEGAVDAVVDNLLGKDPAALARIKHLVRAGLERPLAEGLATEIETTLTHLGEDRPGPGAAPTERRRPWN